MRNLWKVWLALASLLTVVYFVIPQTPETKLVLYNGTGLLALVGVIVGIRINRPADRVPWMFFAGGLASFLIADVCYYVLELTSGDAGPPFPSIADFFYLSMYPLMIFGLARMVRTVAPGRDGATFVDAAVVGISIFGALWVLFVDSVVESSFDTNSAMITQLAYPVMDIAVLTVAARLVVAVHLRHKPFAFIVSAIGSLAIADTAYGIYNTAGTFETGLFIDAFWLAFYVMFSLAALHPGSATTGATEELVEGRLTGRQLVIMFVATLGVPLIDLFWGTPADRPVTIIASALLCLLILLRVFSLTKALERGRDRLRHEASHDSLTGLCNRNLFADRTAAALRESGPNQTLAVLFIDLDDFKVINDSLGHFAGDQLLKEASVRLQRCVRPDDTVARLGGDEFAVLLRSAVDRNDVISVARRVLDAMSAPIDLGRRAVRASCSIGIATDLDESTEVETLLRNADVAMYLSKSRGKGRFEFFEARMHEDAIERLDLKADLERAIEQKEFVLHYQPIFDLKTGHVVLAEALIRWKHPSRGMIAPDRFIPLAEENGLIVPIGNWVLNEACRQAALWRRMEGLEDLSISVNLSMRQLQDTQLLNVLTSALKDSGLPANRLVLEITESMLALDADRTAGVLEQLKTIGVKIAIDDFGTGYSSLSYLRAFPVDSIKIDKSFIRELSHSSTTSALIEAVVNLASALGAYTVAEGIEYSEQATLLRKLGCSRGQGYYYCRPMPGPTLTSLLHEHATDEVEPLEAWRTAAEIVQQRSYDIEVRVGMKEITAISDEIVALNRDLAVPLMASWPWLRNWSESFTAWTPLLIGVRATDSGRMKGLAMLATSQRAEGTAVVAMGNSSSLCTVLHAVDESAADALAAAIARYLTDLPGAWSLDLEQLHEMDSTMLGLADRLDHAQLLPELRVPRVELMGGFGIDSVLSKSMRKQLRRANARIQQDGLTMTIETHRGRQITSSLIDEVESVHVMRDRVSRRQSDLDRPAEREFWRRVVEAGSNGEWDVEITTLRLDGSMAAYVVALLDGDVYRVYDGRMHTEWAPYSPGRIVEAAALERAFADGRFSMLDWMSGVAAEKLLTANVAEGRARLVATSGSRYLTADRRSARVPAPVG
jgi:diguanylate cyclase (GGDEF)-like protein